MEALTMALSTSEMYRYCSANHLIWAEDFVRDGVPGYIFLTYQQESFWKASADLEVSTGGGVGVDNNGAGDSIDVGDVCNIANHEVPSTASAVGLGHNGRKKRRRSGAA